MARKRISEYKAKQILFSKINKDYSGIQIKNPHDSLNFDLKKRYVAKVDQGIKKRMKKGLIALDISKDQILDKLKDFHDQDYSQFLVEEYFDHDSHLEKFISIERERSGLVIYYSNIGGIDIEENKDQITKANFNLLTIDYIAKDLSIDQNFLKNLIDFIEENYISFLEINPLVISHNDIFILDLAIEVDSCGEFFVENNWTKNDFISFKKIKTEQEKNVQQLAETSQAAFTLNILNYNGRIWVLLSGGGASVTLADDVYNLGYGKDLADYSEYSGNPNFEETYIFSKNFIELLLQSKAKNKILIIGGGVANFTDIRLTFKGVIHALDEQKLELQNQGVKVYVRRGGPYQKEGLENMEKFLKENHLYGYVSGPDLILTDIIKLALKENNK